jgi:NAD(P)-dependent dehydrogenase (short-subunit alcohol dehydrogenase family)
MYEVSAPVPADLLAGTSAFVSGGGSGVNLAVASALARAGADLTICGRTQSRLEEAARHLRALGASVVTAVADVRDLEAVTAAFAAGEAEHGPVSTVVCGAAGNFLAPAESITTNGFRAVVDIDLLGSFHCAKAGFEQLRTTRGSILFISGGQATATFSQQAHVSAAKAGVEALSKGLAVEWGPHGIRSNVLVPGPVEGTEGMRRLTESAGDGLWKSMVPLGRFANAEEIGTMATVLSSSWASYISGAAIVVDGGLSLSGAGAFNAAVTGVTP